MRDEIEVAESLLALAHELDGLHQRDLIVACRVLGVHERVMVREVYLAVEELGGLGEGFGNVGEHVCHGFIDARLVWGAVELLAVLGERG